MSYTPEEDMTATELEKRIGHYFEPGDTVYYEGGEGLRSAGTYVVDFVFENNVMYYIREHARYPGFSAFPHQLTLVSTVSKESEP